MVHLPATWVMSRESNYASTNGSTAVECQLAGGNAKSLTDLWMKVEYLTFSPTLGYNYLRPFDVVREYLRSDLFNSLGPCAIEP